MLQLEDGRGTEILDCLAAMWGSCPKVPWAAANCELEIRLCCVLLLRFWWCCCVAFAFLINSVIKYSCSSEWTWGAGEAENLGYPPILFSGLR